jgi:amino acid transporter
MSEEIQNAPKVVPWSILVSVLMNGALGFAMLLAELFCLGDPSASLKQQFPFMNIFLQATNSVTGAAIMVSIIILLSLCTTIGLLASASRMLWSFSRDRGVPGWSFVSKVIQSPSDSLLERD